MIAELAMGAMQPAAPGSFAEKPEEQVKRAQVVMFELPAMARENPARWGTRRAHPAEPGIAQRQVSENRPEQAKRARDSRERLESEVPA